jgi:hypothetical protein
MYFNLDTVNDVLFFLLVKKMSLLSKIELELEKVDEWKPVFLKHAKKLLEQEKLTLPKSHSKALKIIKKLAEMKDDMRILLTLKGKKLDDYLEYMIGMMNGDDVKKPASPKRKSVKKSPRKLDCDEWKKSPNVNPSSGRKIATGGKVYKKIQVECGEPTEKPKSHACPAKIKSGARKGEKCGAHLKRGHKYCGRHE